VMYQVPWILLLLCKFLFFFFVASPSNYATLDSIVSPPMSSTPHVNTNNHHIFTKGNAGIFKPWSHHVMIVLSSS
jgi:hypothetical protein